MNQINKYYTDENTVRFTAFFVVVTTVLALLLKWPYLILFLVFDFAIRALGLSFSPLAHFSKLISKQLGLKPKPIFVSPKRFAALLGSLFSLILFFLMLNGFYNSAYAVGFVLIALASLESFFKICVGCYIYQFLIVPFQNKVK